MKLRAHGNVYPLADIAEERRAREQRRADDEHTGGKPQICGLAVGLEGMAFIGWQAAPSDAPPAAPRERWRANRLWTRWGWGSARGRPESDLGPCTRF